MNARKVLGLAVAAFAVFYAITNPHEAAEAVRTAVAGIRTFASALASGGN
ncbi:hypothetical protein [Actinoplanes friuliensis]|nr:hypothetical protein [Actinoplanes friuliensis]